jgi:O-methyltransferase involved in polyketide biosynthesis
MNKIKIELGNIQSTLLMPLWARVMETQKDEPLLVDRKAVEIIKSVDYDFTPMVQTIEEISIISWISRCLIYDEIINQFILNNPKGVIVNLGCGMDTYYERAINSSVQWFELDLPDVVELRKQFFSETENRQFIACSFLDTQWFSKIQSKQNVLFLSAGVFPYFEEDEIRQFLKALTDTFPNSEILFDVTSSQGVRAANRIIKKTGLGIDAFMKWPLGNVNKVLEWDKRLQLINTFYTYKQKNLKLNLKNRILGVISDFLNIQYVLHLKVAGKN